MPFASPVGYELCFIYLRTCLALVSFPSEAEILPWSGIKAIIPGEELSSAASIRVLPAFWMLCLVHLLGCPSPIQDFFESNFIALPVELVFLLECVLDSFLAFTGSSCNSRPYLACPLHCGYLGYVPEYVSRSQHKSTTRWQALYRS